MITLPDYYKDVMERGTPEAKILLQEELLWASTEAKAILSKTHTERELQERIACLLIAHRGPVLAQFLMERSTGKPMAVDGPGPVIPGQSAGT